MHQARHRRAESSRSPADCVDLSHCCVGAHALPPLPTPPGTVPSTLNNTWADATVERSKLSPREGSETPIKLNPIHGTKT